MEVQVKGSTILRHGQQDSEPREVPLNIFDLFASNIHIAVLYAFSPPTPSNSDLIQGLSKTLLHFPTLTAELGHDHHRRPCLVLGGKGGGAFVVEAIVASKLSDHLPLKPSPDFLLLHPSVEEPNHVLQVQINRFRCGGLVIGITSDHRVADGHSMGSFFFAWSQIVCGLPIRSLPAYDQSWLKPRNPPICDYKHWGIDFAHIDDNENHELNVFQKLKEDVDQSRVTNLLLHFSLEFINKLKSSLREKYRTFEIMLAHIWRKITIARELKNDESTMIRLTVNGRPRMKASVPNEFFGNLVLNAYPQCNVQSLLENSLEDAVKVIREAIVSIDERYIQSFIDFGAKNVEENFIPMYDTEGVASSPNIEADSWVKLKFQEMSFGGGSKLCAFMPSWVPYEGLVIFLPSLSDQGDGVDVFLALFQEHAKKLRQISHSLN